MSYTNDVLEGKPPGPSSATISKRLISEIQIGERHRRDLGDIPALARSIATVGLLHPIVVTTDGQLIAGRRRLAALELLGRDEAPVRVIDIGHNTPSDIARGELAENEARKDFDHLESKAARAAAAIATNPGKSDRAIAAEIGVDHKTVGKARKATGEQSPVQERTGLDGKTRRLPEQKPPPEKRLPPPVETDICPRCGMRLAEKIVLF